MNRQWVGKKIYVKTYPQALTRLLLRSTLAIGLADSWQFDALLSKAIYYGWWAILREMGSTP